MTPVIAATLALLDPSSLVRVDDPAYPGALANSATSSLLSSPPPAGVHWRYESVPELDYATSEAVTVTNADLWHGYGAKGRGVRVAVFDVGWFDALASVAQIAPYSTHDCFVHPSCELPMDTTRPKFSFEEGAHGFACAEVIREVAPEADLSLVRVNSIVGFQNAVDWAVRTHIDVISMSMSFYNETHYDGAASVFDTALKKLEAANVLLVTSAGNDGQSHWSGHFLDADGDGLLDFDGSNRIAVDVGGDQLSAYVNWNQHRRCGDTDLDVQLVDDSGNLYAVASAAQDVSADQCQPVERLNASSLAPGRYYLEVEHISGSLAGVHVDLRVRGSSSFTAPQAAGSLADPASHPLSFAVGAVRASRYLDGGPEGFSSQGPTNSGYPKPDIAGPDGLSGAVFGAGGFFGTSASAPAVAGLVALVMSNDRSLTPRRASEVLQAWAWTDNGAWTDPRWGAGKARLPVLPGRSSGCGGRPLLAIILLPPFWFRRRLAQAGE